MEALLESNDLLTITDAREWASDYLKQNVSKSNIGYLIQYAKISKTDSGGMAKISKQELKEYYDSRDKRYFLDQNIQYIGTQLCSKPIYMYPF